MKGRRRVERGSNRRETEGAEEVRKKVEGKEREGFAKEKERVRFVEMRLLVMVVDIFVDVSLGSERLAF